MKDGMRKVAKEEVRRHEKSMHKMRAGGKTNSDMKMTTEGLEKLSDCEIVKNAATARRSALRTGI